MWALDHMIFIHRLVRQNYNVIVPLNAHIFTSDYRTNITSHLNLLPYIDIIEKAHTESDSVSVVGESFGTIYLTLLTKQFPDTFEKVRRIIWIDPITLNIPFSGLVDYILTNMHLESVPMKNASSYFGIDIDHNIDPVVGLINNENIYRTIHDNANWLDWSLDSKALEFYSDKCMIVISQYEHLFSYNVSAPIMKSTCSVVVTPYFHGTSMLVPPVETFEHLKD